MKTGYHLITLLVFFVVLKPIEPLDAGQSRRDRLIQPERVMQVIGIRRGMKIGIVGAGRGYFTFKMNLKVGSRGKIYANEIDEYNLEYIRDHCEQEEIRNVIPVQGQMDDPCFPIDNLDMVFMCYVFHDLEKPVQLLQNIKKYLRKKGLLVILDQDREKTGNDHFYRKSKILRLIKQAGYRIDRIEDFLKREILVISSDPDSG